MNHITVSELKKMTGTEGLVLQGCGGDLQEWADGINGMLTKEGILLEDDTFKEISVFEHEGRTNILFHMDDVKLDIGKLAMWRLMTHSTFGGTWLSDYLPNRLGVNTDEQPCKAEKPDCPLINADGNIFNIMGIASRTLKDNGMRDAAQEMRQRVTESGSYDNALAIIMEYVNPVDANEPRYGQMMQ